MKAPTLQSCFLRIRGGQDQPHFLPHSPNHHLWQPPVVLKRKREKAPNYPFYRGVAAAGMGQKQGGRYIDSNLERVVVSSKQAPPWYKSPGDLYLVYGRLVYRPEARNLQGFFENLYPDTCTFLLVQRWSMYRLEIGRAHV